MTFAQYDELGNQQPKEPAGRDPFDAPTRSSLAEQDYRPGYGIKQPDRELDPARFTYPTPDVTRAGRSQR
jgi:hypothetical protein